MLDNWNRKKFEIRNYDCQEERRYLRVKFVSKTGNEINKYATNKGRNFEQIHIVITGQVIRLQRQSGSQLILWFERERVRSYDRQQAPEKEALAFFV